MILFTMQVNTKVSAYYEGKQKGHHQRDPLSTKKKVFYQRPPNKNCNPTPPTKYFLYYKSWLVGWRASHIPNSQSCLNFFFGGGGEHPPDATEAFQLLPRPHLSLHHNGKDRCCRANTSDVVINHTNHLHHPQVLSQVPIY